jgi:hypothetical protein
MAGRAAADILFECVVPSLSFRVCPDEGWFTRRPPFPGGFQRVESHLPQRGKS